MKSLLLAAALAAVAIPLIAQPAPRKTATAPSLLFMMHQTVSTPMGALPATSDGQAYAIDGDALGRHWPEARTFGSGAFKHPELRDAAKAESIAGMPARAALEDLLGPSGHKVKCRAVGSIAPADRLPVRPRRPGAGISAGP